MIFSVVYPLARRLLGCLMVLARREASKDADLLVPEHQEFGVPGRLTARQHHQAAEQTACEQVGDGEDHSAMISVRKTGQAM